MGIEREEWERGREEVEGRGKEGKGKGEGKKMVGSEALPNKNLPLHHTTDVSVPYYLRYFTTVYEGTKRLVFSVPPAVMGANRPYFGLPNCHTKRRWRP